MSTQTTEQADTDEPYVRDYVTSPSINSPQSADEARLAVIAEVRRSITDPSHPGYSPLRKPYTTEMGFGFKRTEQQARWLEEARVDLLTRFEAVLDAVRADVDEDAVRANRA